MARNQVRRVGHTKSHTHYDWVCHRSDWMWYEHFAGPLFVRGFRQRRNHWLAHLLATEG